MEHVELAELSKYINRCKRNDICAHNIMAVIEKTLENGRRSKATGRKLATGRDKVYELRDKQGTVYA